MGLLPQERDGKLAARRAAQQKPDWSWDEEQDTKWNRIGELIQVVQTAEANEEELGIFNPEDKELFLRAVELVHKKRFQAGGEGIRDLSFLERLPQIKELDLWDNDIEDLSLLARLRKCKRLGMLNLSNTGLGGHLRPGVLPSQDPGSV